MERAELEALGRDELIARAEEAGVSRANVLTRPELVDELLLRSAPRKDDPRLRRMRGLFGIARDLVAAVVERGLNLPDAAERIRALGLPPPPPARTMPAAVPTVTLAEIYAAQGHRAKAIDTLRHVLSREADHAHARALLARLESDPSAAARPVMAPEEEEEEAASPAAAAPAPDTRAAEAEAREPMGFLDDAPLPPKYDVDECVALPVDPTTLFVYWEARDAMMEHLRRTKPDGRLALRVLVIVPTWDGPRTAVRDVDVESAVGDWFVRDLPAGCVVRAAVGWKAHDAFLPIAHSPALETPPGAPSPLEATRFVRWTPEGPRPVQPGDPDLASIEQALGIAQGTRRRRRHGGSSEVRAFG